MSELKNLRELLIDELRDLHSAETQLVKALPKMAKAASDSHLKTGFSEHLEQTKEHVSRLEKALGILDVKPSSKTCEAMKGLVKEGAEAIETDGPDPVRDANLIGAAQRVEHYEIAAYGTARNFAETLGESEIVQLLQSTLDEEAATDRKLTELSETVNEAALSAGEEA